VLGLLFLKLFIQILWRDTQNIFCIFLLFLLVLLLKNDFFVVAHWMEVFYWQETLLISWKGTRENRIKICHYQVFKILQCGVLCSTGETFIKENVKHNGISFRIQLFTSFLVSTFEFFLFSSLFSCISETFCLDFSLTKCLCLISAQSYFFCFFWVISPQINKEMQRLFGWALMR